MSDEPKASHGLDPELLAAYIDQRLSPEQRAGVEAQLASDPDSYAVMVEAMKTADAIEIAAAAPPGSPMPLLPKGDRRRLPWVITGGVLAAAAAVALVVWTQPDLLRRLRGVDSRDPLFGQLLEAVGEERYIEGRLTGGFRFGPLRPTTRGPSNLSEQNLALLAASGKLQRAAQNDPVPEKLHAWGTAQILLGEYDDGVRNLLDASRERQDHAPWLADLAAAYLARARVLDRSEDWPRALEAAERALQIDPELVEALFNRALALESLHLDQQAESAWRTYLERDADSPWAAEARRRLAALAEPKAEQSWDREQPRLATAALPEFDAIATAFPQETRLHLEETLVEEWARLAEARRWSELIAISDKAVLLAGRYQQLFEDRFSASIHDDLRRRALANRVDPELIAALRNYVEGSRWLQKARPSQAESPLVKALPVLAGARSPLWVQASILLSEIPSLRGDLEKEAALLMPALEEANRHGWLNAAARGHNRRALLHYRQGDLQSSLRDRVTALSIYRRTKDPDRITALEATAGDNHRYVGDYARVWTHAVASLRSSRTARQSSSRHMALLYASIAAEDERLPYTARALQTDLVAQGRRLQQANDFVIGLEGRARSALMLGRLDEAERDVTEAVQWLEKMPDPVNRERNALELAETGALVWAARESTDSVARINQAIEYLHRQNYQTRLSPLLQARADLAIRRGDLAGAERDLTEARALVEQQRGRLDRTARRGHLDALRPLAQKLARIALERKANNQVLAHLESSRARVVMDSMASAELAIDSSALAADVAVLYYSTGELPLLALIRSTGFQITPLACADHAIKAEVSAVFRVARLRSPSTAGEPHLRRLYDCLVRPILGQLAGVRHLVIVPDGILRLVPFAALLDGPRFVVERFDVSYAPSLRWLGGAPSRVAGGAPRITAIGDPALTGELQERWPRLPFAKSETEAVYALYGTGTKGVAAEATAQLFEEGLRQSDVVHVAAHAVITEARPEWSHLLLAANPGNRSQLSAEDLWKLTRVKARIVVLAACDTGLADPDRAEGLSALSEPLLAAGVRGLVVSLWPVEDQAGSALMVEMHHSLKAGKTAGTALSSAQRTAIAGDRSSWQHWAAFAAFSTSS